MVAGGASSQITAFDWSRYCAMGRLSLRQDDPAAACRPFDAGRDGEVHGEGAAAFVLENRRHAEARKANVLAGVAGWGAACDPPGASGRGRGLQWAVRAALEQAGLDAGDVDHVNAHGASTLEDDVIEAVALAGVLPGVPVTAPKSYFGNLGAAGGAAELIASVLGLGDGCVPRTLNCDRPDPACPVEVLREPGRWTKPAAVAVNRTPVGQSAAVVVVRPA
jgi:3-oxoacyl-[acyl-carrier-protein] synthase II